MAMIQTSHHAKNLFSLTMETRFGASWAQDMAADAIAALADEIAHGFGATVLETKSVPGTCWQFPDGSQAIADGSGLTVRETSAQAAAE